MHAPIAICVAQLVARSHRGVYAVCAFVARRRGGFHPQGHSGRRVLVPRPLLGPAQVQAMDVKDPPAANEGAVMSALLLQYRDGGCSVVLLRAFSLQCLVVFPSTAFCGALADMRCVCDRALHVLCESAAVRGKMRSWLSRACVRVFVLLPVGVILVWPPSLKPCGFPANPSHGLERWQHMCMPL